MYIENSRSQNDQIIKPPTDILPPLIAVRVSRSKKVKMRKWNCKPDSVLDDHLSWRYVSVSLKRPTRGIGGPPYSPSTWSCFGWRLPGRSVTRLPVSSYLAFPSLPFRAVFVSMALFKDHSFRALPGTLPLEVRTFLGFRRDHLFHFLFLMFKKTFFFQNLHEFRIVVKHRYRCYGNISLFNRMIIRLWISVIFDDLP